MPKNFWKVVNPVIDEADVLLLVLDCRLVEETRNTELEQKVKQRDKPLIYVLNKCDLVDDEKLATIKKNLSPAVFVSAKDHLGTTLLRKEIMKWGKGEKIRVGVLGYPNTGKSSIINALTGGGGAPVAPISGYTKGIQLLKATQKLYLLDTPGVIPFMETDEVKHLLIGSRNPDQAKDPEDAAERLLERFSDNVPEWYGIEASEDGFDMLERVALKLNLLQKGGVADTKRAAVKILFDWQKGKIV